MKSQTTRPLIDLTAVLLLCLAVIGCQAFRNGAPPSALEQKFFDVQTNYTPIVRTVTNLVPVTVYQTNVQPVTLTVTNEQHVTQTVTNFSTNVVQTVIQQPQVSQVSDRTTNYTYSPNSTTTGAEGAISAIPVYGTLASTALAGIAAVWGWFRSSKQGAAGATLAQSIETMREFVKQLPNGAVYDNALTQWLQQHQADTGTITQVLTYLKNDVDNQDAKLAADQVLATIRALNPSAVPPTPAKPA